MPQVTDLTTLKNLQQADRYVAAQAAMTHLEYLVTATKDIYAEYRGYATEETASVTLLAFDTMAEAASKCADEWRAVSRHFPTFSAEWTAAQEFVRFARQAMVVVHDHRQVVESGPRDGSNIGVVPTRKLT